MENPFKNLSGMSNLKRLEIEERLNNLKRSRSNSNSVSDTSLAATLRSSWNSWKEAQCQNKEDNFRNKNENYVASYAQKRLWFLESVNDEPSCAYNIPIALSIKGKLSKDALKWSFEKVIRKHKVLNSCLIYDDGELFLEPSSYESVEIEEFQATESGLKDVLLQQANKPFELDNSQLIRVGLIGLAEEHSILIICVHHIVADGWSISVLVKECLQHYQEFFQLGTTSSSLEGLPFSYFDYISWLNSSEYSRLLEPSRAYWIERLNGIPSKLDLNIVNSNRGKRRKGAGSNLEFSISSQTYSGLAEIARSHSATPFMVFLAAFNLILHQYSGQSDLVIGTPVANRNILGLEKLIGLFSNTLVIRNILNPNMSFVEFLLQVRQSAMADFQHQHYPFEKIVEELNPVRSEFTNPIFQVLFVFQNTPKEELSVPGLELELISCETSSAKFDILFMLTETSNGVLGNIEYSDELFSRSDILRFIRHFDYLLNKIIENPNLRLSDFPSISPVESKRLEQWNETKSYKSFNNNILDLFESAVHNNKNAVALCFKDQEMTYEQLSVRSNRIAKHLLEQSISEEDIVAVHLERSLDLIVSILAILKSGAAYLPLDPTYPVDRLNYMLADSGAKIVLSHSSLKEIRGNKEGTIFVDRLSLDACASDSINKINTSKNLAYVIYTSGTTGKPKGSMLTHKNLYHRILWMKEHYAINSSHTFLQKTPTSFDVSVWEIFLPLVSGSKLVIAEPILHKDPYYISDLIKKSNVSVIHFVPSMLQAFLEVNDIHRESPLSLVFCSGEELSYSTKNLFFQHYSAELNNLYGPTETSIDVSYYNCDKDSTSPIIPIGRPISDTQLHILDKELSHVPPGVCGDLYIGGIGVGRGYHNKPRLTAEKFIPDPFNMNVGARLYKSGDRAKFLDDGSIVYLGREDRQVKIRGQRIELGEIDFFLSEHESISQSITVLDHKIDANEPKIISYFRPSEQALLEEKDWNASLRHYLKDKLPDHMLPSCIIRVEEFTLSPNGKLDQHSLPQPKELFDKRFFAKPSSVLEDQLLKIWSAVLKVEEKLVSVDTPFFDCGGHSLLAIKLIDRIRNDLNVKLSIKNIFDHETIRKQAVFIENETALYDGRKLELTKTGDLAVSYYQLQMLQLNSFNSVMPHYNIPLSFKLEGSIDVVLLEKTIRYIFKKHKILRTVYRFSGDGEVKATLLELGDNIVDYSELECDESKLKILVEEESKKVFDLASDLMARVKLIKYDTNGYLLILTIHHIACDGWSLGILTRDIYEIYSGLVNKSKIHIETAHDYFDYAAWQNNRLTKKFIESEIGYWGKKLEGIPKLSNLPLDFERPKVFDYRGNSFNYCFSHKLSKRINEFTTERNVSVFMFLHSVLAILLNRYSGDDDIVIGVPIANRAETALESIVGYFVNTIPVRTNFRTRDISSFESILSQNRDTMLEAYEHQELPFNLLASSLGGVHSTSYNPIFQVLMSIQNHDEGELELPRVIVDKMEITNGTCKSDLSLTFVHHGGRLSVNWEYATSLFEEDTIRKMANRFENLVNEVLDSPDAEISSFCLKSNENEELNSCKVLSSEHAGLVENFERNAREYPDSIAVEHNEFKLTYAQLNEKSEVLAGYLRERDIRANAVVAVYLDRSVEYICTVIAIWKAGYCFLPLDPRSPDSRLNYILNDSKAKLVLTSSSFTKSSGFGGIEKVYVNKVFEEANSSETIYSTELAKVCSNSVAYIMYTSGTTGRPKGVPIKHKQLATFIAAAIPRYTIGFNERVLQFSSLTFDIFIEELCMSFTTASTLVIRNESTIENVAAFRDFLIDKQISLMSIPTNYWHRLCAYIDSFYSTELSLKKVVIGGESASKKSWKKWNQLVGESIQLINTYGPTEATCVSSAFDMTRYCEKYANVPIGKALDFYALKVVDSNGNECLDGIPGELAISGDAVASGYLNIESTSFSTYNVGKDNYLRSYKTGDRVRKLNDGNFEYLGRIDSQVKLDGYRVNLSEIEFLIMELPVVEAAVVVYQENDSKKYELSAYYVVHKDDQSGFTDCVDDIKYHLNQFLPKYMMPTNIIELQMIPLTSTGKIDRANLPVPQPKPDAMLIYPTTDIEKCIANYWIDVLGVEYEQCHLEADFFLLGGDSLNGLSVLSLLNNKFKLGLDLLTLFKFSQLNKLSEFISLSVKKEKLSTELDKLNDGDFYEVEI